MAFADNLLQLPSIDGLAALHLRDASGTLVASIENKPGKQEGLELFAEHTADAHANPGAHPNIDRLLQIIESGQSLQVERVEA